MFSCREAKKSSIPMTGTGGDDSYATGQNRQTIPSVTLGVTLVKSGLAIGILDRERIRFYD